MALGLLLNSANQTKDALSILNGIVEENPGYCDAIQGLLYIAGKDTLYDTREKTLDLLENLGENHIWAQQTLLKEARNDGNLDKTRDLLENLGNLLPWEGYQARLHDMNEDYEASIKDFQKRWEIFSERDYYPFSISQSFARLGNHTAQREWLEKTLAINPGHREALLDLVNLDCYENKRDDAMARLRAYLQVEPADSYFRQRLSHLEGVTAFEEFRIDSATVIEDAKKQTDLSGSRLRTPARSVDGPSLSRWFPDALYPSGDAGAHQGRGRSRE